MYNSQSRQIVPTRSEVCDDPRPVRQKPHRHACGGALFQSDRHNDVVVLVVGSFKGQLQLLQEALFSQEQPRDVHINIGSLCAESSKQTSIILDSFCLRSFPTVQSLLELTHKLSRHT